MARPKVKRQRRLRSAPAGADDRLARLAAAIGEVRTGRRPSPRTAKLLAAGTPKMVQKLIEEAAEAGNGAMRGDPLAVAKESVDLLYNLAILWSDVSVDPGMVWAEMDRREALLGMVEKPPKPRGSSAQAADDAALSKDPPAEGG